MIFAKQILCAAVAESEDELDNMYLVRREMEYVECVHRMPILSSYVAKSIIEYEEMDVAIVRLQSVGFFHEIVGKVGKCPECGKIYYYIPDMSEITVRKEVRKYANSNRRGL